jgi:uncharacterized protein with HEPN domain
VKRSLRCRTCVRAPWRNSKCARIVNFRNPLTHEYPIGDDALIKAIVTNDVALLRKESAALLARPDTAPSEQ